MKKLIALLCVLTLLAALPACGAKNADPLAEKSLQEILDASLKDVPDLPAYEPMALDAETFEFFSFVPYKDGYEGLAADALINATAHSVVLVRVPEEEAESVAEAMRQNADPRKWICVGAEKVAIDRCGGTILLVMSSGETANAILTNFKALYGAKPTEEELKVPEPEVDPAMEDIPPAELVIVDENGNPVSTQTPEDTDEAAPSLGR